MTFVDFTEQQKVTASDAASDDYFGYSVAIDGDTAVVGAYGEDPDGKLTAGSAYVFTRSDGVWTQLQKLNADDATAGDYFGYSVAIDGDTIVVGAYMADPSSISNAGSVYIFNKSGDVWNQRQKIIADDSYSTLRFGYSVSIDGDTIVVGAPFDNLDGDDKGSVYVFHRNAFGAWSQQQKIIGSSPATRDYFGTSASISGDTIVVGAYQDDPSSLSDAGSIYVFTRLSGAWTQQQEINASDKQSGDYFGHSVAIDGDTIVVGAYQEDPSSISNAGSAYVFTRSDGVWTEQQKITSSDAQSSDNFGRSVAIDGDMILVGAYQEDPSSISNAGSAYVFTRSDGVWTQRQKIIASDAQSNDNFGYSVAIDSDTIVVGAYNEDPSSISNAGSAYVFTTVLPEVIPEEPDVTKKYTGESYSLLLRDGDIQVDDNGTPKYDYTAESRVYFRLMCRRGQCWYDPDLGSRLYTIKTLKEARQKVPAYVDEALLPLVKDGTIISATVDDYYEEPITGMLKAHLMITVPSDNKVDLGLIPIGRTMFSQERAQTVPTPAPVA